MQLIGCISCDPNLKGPVDRRGGQELEQRPGQQRQQGRESLALPPKTATEIQPAETEGQGRHGRHRAETEEAFPAGRPWGIAGGDPAIAAISGNESRKPPVGPSSR